MSRTYRRKSGLGVTPIRKIAYSDDAPRSHAPCHQVIATNESDFKHAWAMLHMDGNGWVMRVPQVYHRYEGRRLRQHQNQSLRAAIKNGDEENLVLLPFIWKIFTHY